MKSRKHSEQYIHEEFSEGLYLIHAWISFYLGKQKYTICSIKFHTWRTYVYTLIAQSMSSNKCFFPKPSIVIKLTSFLSLLQIINTTVLYTYILQHTHTNITSLGYYNNYNIVQISLINTEFLSPEILIPKARQFLVYCISGQHFLTLRGVCMNICEICMLWFRNNSKYTKCVL